ncbi:hypothetical protein [Chromobacterium sp. IIBBL 290-4]|uniref:hypothetical protein n=1 Tax=Chromobacterium sp. IIBBL 290-4 TaxID=2953890 RepID=UPI0020B69CCF|nr:hypothetical protein [Chromobacterium sp. IIBBL 290-4]UTH74539.1 hypothetical protein NKT35_23975 [Chromobacterium sp. IIBBL 290-4]
MQRIPWQRFSRLTFANGEELKRALLLRLASKPGFRFAADVFVAARVNPVDWRPMRAPMRMQSLSLLASGALLTAVCLSMDTHQPLLQRSWPLLAVLLACALGSMLLWCCLFPDLRQSIRFLPEGDSALAKPCQDEKKQPTPRSNIRAKNAKALPIIDLKKQIMPSSSSQPSQTPSVLSPKELLLRYALISLIVTGIFFFQFKMDAPNHGSGDGIGLGVFILNLIHHAAIAALALLALTWIGIPKGKRLVFILLSPLLTALSLTLLPIIDAIQEPRAIHRLATQR